MGARPRAPPLRTPTSSSLPPPRHPPTRRASLPRLARFASPWISLRLASLRLRLRRRAYVAPQAPPSLRRHLGTTQAPARILGPHSVCAGRCCWRWWGDDGSRSGRGSVLPELSGKAVERVAHVGDRPPLTAPGSVQRAAPVGGGVSSRSPRGAKAQVRPVDTTALGGFIAVSHRGHSICPLTWANALPVDRDGTARRGRSAVV